MDFAEVLGKAWHITWKHKVLWVFGILAGCSTGGGGAGGSGWRQGSSFSSDGSAGIERYAQQGSEWIGQHWWVVALIILGIIVLMLLGIFLGTVGKIGLIRGALRGDEGAERLHFRELFKESTPYFWRVFLLSFLIGLAFLIVFVPLVLFGVLTAGVGFLCLIPLICVLVPVTWVVGLVVRQADAAMVIENLSMADGVRRGWAVVRSHLGPVLLIWLITGLIGIVIGVAIALPILIVVVPAAIGFAMSGGEMPTTALLVSGLCFVVYLPFLIVARGILTTFVQSAWTLTFLRLTRPGEKTGVPEALPANA